MSELLSSIRADLTDRRLLPLVALVGACLVAAIAYALLGGSSGSSGSSGPSNVPTIAPPSGLAVTATAPEHAVAETTDGFKEQRSGKARNPFEALPGTATAAAATSSSASTTSSGASGESSGTSTTESTGSTEEGTETKSGGTKKPKAPTPAYDVAVEFGTLPAGITPETAQLTPFTKLNSETRLPNRTTVVVQYVGVIAGGKSAVFEIASEAIISGTGTCRPSPENCQFVDLKPGETEQFDVTNPDASTTVYELRVLKIEAAKKSKKAKGARVEARSASVAGRALVRRSDKLAAAFLHYSSKPGVLVFSAPRASAARRARTALARPAR